MNKNLLERRLGPRGFTLLELLVVIGIVGILASLIMPAVSRAKRNAQNISCVSQLRQLGLATRMYADDHNQRMPSAELLPSMPLDPASPQPRICDVLAPYAGKVSTGTNASASIFRCPAEKGRSYLSEGSSYEWNAELNGRRLDETRSTGLRLVEIEIVNGKEVLKQDEQKTLLFPPETTPLLLDYEENHPRPPKPGKNVVFMDGHVTGLEVPAFQE